MKIPCNKRGRANVIYQRRVADSTQRGEKGAEVDKQPQLLTSLLIANKVALGKGIYLGLGKIYFMPHNHLLLREEDSKIWGHHRP